MNVKSESAVEIESVAAIEQLLFNRGWRPLDGPPLLESVGLHVDLLENLQRSQSSLRLDLYQLQEAVKNHRLDGHVYGRRPCATCKAVTKALGEPFGCDLFRLTFNKDGTST